MHTHVQALADHVMALFKYLQPVCTSGSSGQDSSVASKVASEASSVVCLVDKNRKPSGKPRSEYIKLSPEKKAEIGKYANINGVANAVRHHKDMNLKGSSARDW